MTTLVCIQARLGSSRYPRKVLADLCGQPVLQHVVERAQAITRAERVVVVCPMDDYEALLQAVGAAVPVFGFQGDPNDVLTRYASVVRHFRPRFLCRITSDCPFLDPALADDAIRAVSEAGYRYACTRHDGSAFSWPDGLDVEAMPAHLILAADRHAHKPSDREHVTPWVRRQAGQNVYTVTCPEAWPSCKLSIDEPGDLDRARHLTTWLASDGYGWRATWRAVKAMTTEGTCQ